MNNVTIHLQLKTQELAKARELASMWGFSSAEEALQEFITRFLKKPESTEFISLTKKAKARYTEMTEDFKAEKNIHQAKTTDEFFAQLNA